MTRFSEEELELDRRRRITQESINASVKNNLIVDFSDVESVIKEMEKQHQPKPLLFLGIDPGETGAMACIGQNNEYVVVYDCPSTFHEIANLIEIVTKEFKARAIIEKVNPYYKSSAKSAFTFGCNFAGWQMALACYRIPYDFVTPRKWQKAMFDSAKQLDDTKKQSHERASRLFPYVVLKTKRGRILDGRCDALLLAEYLRRQNP